VIRDNDVVVYNFAFGRLADGRQATHEGSKNYGPLKQKQLKQGTLFHAS
jgi:hypothetical protein